MKVWITKYALTKGIYEAEGEKSSFPDMIRVRVDNKGVPLSFPISFHKGEWHTCKGDAIIKANQMKENKLNSLRKMSETISNLTFR